MTINLIRLLVAALLGVATSVVGFASPAYAAGCTPGTGVTVVVSSSVSCDGDGGGTAASNFAAVGHELKYASRAPGFVCRVDGYPASDPCTVASPADAYWGLFWSDGKSGKWIYSSLGVTSLKVPAGGSVAFVFQNGDGKTWPSVAPNPGASSAPKPTAKPTSKPGNSSKPQPGTSAKPKPDKSATARGSAATSPSASASTATPASGATTSPSASGATASAGAPESSDATAAASQTAVEQADAAESSGGFGPWLAGAAVVAVLAAAGFVAVRCRRA